MKCHFHCRRNYIKTGHNSTTIEFFSLTISLKKYSITQECIPVGCVSAARRPYAGVCFPGGGGGLPGLGGSAWSGGVSAWSRGESSWSGGGLAGPGGVCLVQGGACLVRGGGSGIPACTEADTLPPVDRHTPVKTLPWPQLRCGR